MIYDPLRISGSPSKTSPGTCPLHKCVSLCPESIQMDTTNLLLWIHIVALVAGGSNTVVMPIIGVVMPIIGATLSKVDEQTRVTLFTIGFHMATARNGPLLLLLKYGGLEGATPWFRAKMVSMVVMFAAIGFEETNFKKSTSRSGSLLLRRRA